MSRFPTPNNSTLVDRALRFVIYLQVAVLCFKLPRRELQVPYYGLLDLSLHSVDELCVVLMNNASDLYGKHVYNTETSHLGPY